MFLHTFISPALQQM